MTDKIAIAIDETRCALQSNSESRWIIGYSGGKDSTATLKIFLEALREAKHRPKYIDIIYCDTGVESVPLDRYVKGVLSKLKLEFATQRVPIGINVLSAPVSNRFFVKIIGRGYPPPTNSFRWCTKNLRIRPVAEFIKSATSQDAIVVLGMRRSESRQRDRSLSKSEPGHWQQQREGRRSYRMFLPIIDFDLSDVWDSVFVLAKPFCIDPNILDTLYRGATGECPVIKSPVSPPCASGRFGCWTCTVVRRDRSTEAQIANGMEELKPYLAFRNWLAEIRNHSSRRWPVRRNGTPLPGPFTLQTRAEILSEVEKLEAETHSTILLEGEREYIETLWKGDLKLEEQIMGASRAEA